MTFLQTIPGWLLSIIIGQTIVAIWAIIKLYFDVKELKVKVEDQARENKGLREEVKKLSEILLLVKHSVDLLVLGRLKTGKVNQEQL